MAKKIWVKLFKIKNRYYCYDVSSNHIMEITQILYEILKKYNYSNRSEILSFFRNKFAEGDIIEALKSIDNFNKKNKGFCHTKKIRLAFPFSKTEYEKSLKNLVNHIVLNVTENCNFRCKYCKFSGHYSQARQHSHKKMPLEVMKRAIDFLVENSSYLREESDMELVLGFYGGEPLLESDKIFKAIEYIEKEYNEIFSKFKFSMTTNGSLLNKEIIEKVSQYDFTLLVSFDGPDDIHNRYRVFAEGGETHDLIKNKLALIKEIDEEYFKRKVGFSVVLSPKFRMNEVVDYFKNHYYYDNRVYLFSLVDYKDTDFFDSFDLEQEWNEFLKDERKIHKEYIHNKVLKKKGVVIRGLFENNISNIHKRKINHIPDELFPNGICLPGLQKTFVDTDGNFHFCEKISWDFNIGNIRSGFNVDKIYRIIDDYINTTNNCKDCWAVRFCRDCFLSAIKDGSFSREEKKKSCKRKKKEILSYLEDYVTITGQNPEAFDVKNKTGGNITNEIFKFLKKN
jgi:uncharacterized protein